MTHNQREVQNLMLDYSNKYELARAHLELRAVNLFLLFVACWGWGLFVWKCVS